MGTDSPAIEKIGPRVYVLSFGESRAPEPFLPHR